MNEKWTAWLGLAVAVVIAYMSIDLLLPRRNADTEATDE